MPDELLKLGVASDEVRLAIDLDEHAELAVVVDVAANQPLTRLLADALLRLGRSLLAQDLDGAVHVAVRFFERALAFHHARAGPLAQLLHILGGIVFVVVMCQSPVRRACWRPEWSRGLPPHPAQRRVETPPGRPPAASVSPVIYVEHGIMRGPADSRLCRRSSSPAAILGRPPRVHRRF